MKLNVYCIRDRAGNAYQTPLFLPTSGMAIRSFGDAINSSEPNNMLKAHPEDFDLYHLGTFEVDSGMFDTGVPKQIAVGKDLVVKSSE